MTQEIIPSVQDNLSGFEPFQPDVTRYTHSFGRIMTWEADP